ncbi:MAG TPA: hypothetical protein VGY66_23485 [Gemmataceae bacterium]|jgi:type II secretory pathway component PulK|nr:hypothetical protein [Gemmataceae bacterium]
MIVLVVLVVLSLAAYNFNELMTSEARAADSYRRAIQARSFAESGGIYVMSVLSDPNAFSGFLNSNPFDNPAFGGTIVAPNDNPNLQGRFLIIAPMDPDDQSGGGKQYRNGVIDESGKININALMQLDPSGTILYNVLMLLPNMTDEIANSIIDWIDADDTPRPNGAESDYYSSLSPPYQAKNGPLDSIEELLFVKGVTPQLLYGNDLNRDGIFEPEEDDGTGAFNPGWAGYLTIYSREQNVDSTGAPRIFVNGSDLQGLYNQLSTALSQDLANYIVAYRMYGPAATTSGSGAGAAAGSTGKSGTGTGAGNNNTSSGPKTGATGQSAGSSGMAGGAGAGATGGAGAAGSTASRGTMTLSRNSLGNLSQGQPKPIASLYELINSSVSIPSTTPNDQPTIYPSPLNTSTLATLLPEVLDKLTTVNGGEMPARVNVLTAPRAVLAAMPGLAESDVQNILSNRPGSSAIDGSDTSFQTPAWLITHANLNPKTLQSLDRYITSRTQVYRLQALGYFDRGGPTARIEAVFDTNNGRPRMLYWRDITELGKGFNPQAQN